MRSRQRAQQNLQELQQVLELEWGRIPQDRIRRLVEPIPGRVRVNVGTAYINFEVTSTEHYGL